MGGCTGGEKLDEGLSIGYQGRESVHPGEAWWTCLLVYFLNASEPECEEAP